MKTSNLSVVKTMPQDKNSGPEADDDSRVTERKIAHRDAQIAALTRMAGSSVETARQTASLLADVSTATRTLVESAPELLRQPLAASVFVRLGEACHELGETDAARAFFERALADGPSADALGNLGVLAYAAGDSSSAEQYFLRANEADPASRETRENLRRLYAGVPALMEKYRGSGVSCPCCGGNFQRFLHGGPKLRPNAMCPQCGSLERHRLMRLYFERHTNLFTAKLKVLHVAPEAGLKRELKGNPNIDYVSADIDSPLADERMDITQIPYDDNTFDVILCSHVLEHIPDDGKAMCELHRVLKPGGWALLQVPIDSNREKTFEDPAITDPGERERLFGQHDHVRWYGRDYPQRLAKAGFAVSVEAYLNTFSAEGVRRYGLGAGEEIHLCRKDATHAVAEAGNPAQAQDVPLPPRELRFMNESDERFIEIGALNLDILRANGFRGDTRLLDIGCGYGRLPVSIIRQGGFRGEYTGVDILPPHIKWCRDAIASRYPRFRFDVLDIRNDRYNPTGHIDAREYRFPFNAASFDMACLFSVFTHMYEPEIVHYLEEMRRVLTGGGTVVATFFLMDADRMERVCDAPSGLAMRHELNAVTRYHNATDPLHAIAYDRQHISRRIEEAGFSVRECSYGNWAGDSSRSFQDIMVLTAR